jgi:hypothetical protein
MNTFTTGNGLPINFPSYKPSIIDSLVNFGGMKVIVSNYLQKSIQFRFPKSKTKRIRKKWRKRKENYKFIPMGPYIMNGNTIICSPNDAEKLKEQINAEERSSL